jgi:hypothetical protein
LIPCPERLPGEFFPSARVLNQAIKRNIGRLTADFMFQLSVEELGIVESLRSQTVTSKIQNSSRRSLAKPDQQSSIGNLFLLRPLASLFP